MNLQADLTFCQIGRELCLSGNLNAIDPNRAGLAFDEHLHVIPTAFGVGGDARTLKTVNAAGGEDAVERRVNLDLEAAVLLLVGTAAKEDAAVGIVGGLDLGAKEKVLEPRVAVLNAVAV